jgi:phosphopantetheinyl transferase (holo-ACP synthase)
MNGYDRWADSKKTSTGNDVVFLPATRPERTGQPRFYSRILTPAEVEGYYSHRLTPSDLSFDHYVWLCWSVKESVYKYQKRLYPELLFSPLRIAIRQIVVPHGEIDHYAGVATNLPVAGDAKKGDGPRDTLYSRTLIRDCLILTVVSEDPTFSGTHTGFACIDSPAYADQSAAVRSLVLGELKTVLSCDELRLQKDPAGCPMVLAGENQLMTPIPVSLSHHDRYIGYSFYLNKVV